MFFLLMPVGYLCKVDNLKNRMKEEYKTDFWEEFRVDDVDICDYERIKNVISVLDRCLDVFQQRVGIVDFHKMEFLYVKDSNKTLCDHSPLEIKEMGFDFFEKYIPHEERDSTQRYTREIFRKLNDMTVEEEKDSVFFLSNCVKTGNSKIRVGNVSTPLAFSKSGKVWLVLNVLSVSPNCRQKRLMVKHVKSNYWEKYSEEKDCWEETNDMKLATTEKKIMAYSCQGIPNKTICELMTLSEGTIKWYRQQVFDRWGVSCMSEAIAFAHFYRLL